jgi:uncharacterized Zn-binding protein involved in type VI secretion
MEAAMVDSAAVGRVIAHGASTAQAASHTEGGPRPLSLWTDAGNSVSSWAHNLRFAKATVAGLTEKKWSSTAVADIPGSLEARAEGVADAAKNVVEAKRALATVGATFETLTAVEQLVSAPFSAIPFPAMPAARIFDMAVGIPHAHLHPPNLVPPAPIFPLPSLGPILPIPYVSGAEKVLINGVPAARCGDIGASIWCGGYFPFYEIFLGSSNVWIQGQRAARLGVDVTKHCIFSTPKPKDLPVGCAIGLITTASPNVIIGGIPLPSLTNMAVGLAFKAVFSGIGKIVKAVRAAKAAAAAEKAAQEAAAKAAREAAEKAAKEAAAKAASEASVADKLERYLLNPDHPVGGSKAKWFKEALGFTRDNAGDLAKQIVFDESKAVQTQVTQYGTKFNQTIDVLGANGRTIPVKTAWIRGPDGIPKLVTAVPGN